MSNVHDEARDMLVGHMNGSLGRVIAALDARDALNALTTRNPDQDDWDALDEGVQDLLRDHGVEPDDEYGEWDASAAEDAVSDALDPLAITYEKGEPFDVALTIGGPNIYLVDFGGFGGPQLRGAWGGDWQTMTGPDVTRAVEHYQEEMRDIYGD